MFIRLTLGVIGNPKIEFPKMLLDGRRLRRLRGQQNQRLAPQLDRALELLLTLEQARVGLEALQFFGVHQSTAIRTNEFKPDVGSALRAVTMSRVFHYLLVDRMEIFRRSMI